MVNMNKLPSSDERFGGIGKKSDASSTAKIGSPAVTTPSTGIVEGFIPIFANPCLVNSIARGFVGSRWMNPFFSSRAR